MKHFDEIYEVAADNYGIVTAAQARELGISKSELNRWVDIGRLERRGRGVYKLVMHTPTELDPYAEAVALVGDDSFLLGETVLAMHGLALVNPRKFSIGTPKRIRKILPPWVEAVTVSNKDTTHYEGIPSQTVTEAILDCRGRVMTSQCCGCCPAKRPHHQVRAPTFERGALMSIPNSRRNLDIAIERLAKDSEEAVRIRRTMANAIVGQLLPDGAVKGGSSLIRWPKSSMR